MVKEYIEREAALQHKRKMSGADFGGEFWDEAVLCEDIRNIPAADVVEVRYGHWIETSYPEVHRCSFCDKPSNTSKGLHKYCPECGAKMDGGK